MWEREVDMELISLAGAELGTGITLTDRGGWVSLPMVTSIAITRHIRVVRVWINNLL